jgi:hypothetical protein
MELFQVVLRPPLLLPRKWLDFHQPIYKKYITNLIVEQFTKEVALG